MTHRFTEPLSLDVKGFPLKKGVSEANFTKGPLRVKKKAPKVLEDPGICIHTHTRLSSTHLSKLPGNKQLNFFGEPFYVLPKS